MSDPTRRPGHRYGAAVRLVPVVALLGVLLAACGSEGPSDYGDETRANVLTACTSEADRPIVGDVCACAYRSIRTTLPYDRFDELDRQLRERPGSPLPEAVLEVVADCVVEVGDL